MIHLHISEAQRIDLIGIYNKEEQDDFTCESPHRRDRFFVVEKLQALRRLIRSS